MIKGFLGDMTGFADTCRVVPQAEIEKEKFHNYVLNDETAYIHFQSGKLEYIFTDKALITVVGETSASKKRLLTRFEYDLNPLSNINFETAGFGLTDLDCELKFEIGGKPYSLEVHKSSTDEAKDCYKCLVDVSRHMMRNKDKLNFFLQAQAIKQTKIDLDGKSDITGALRAIAVQNQAYVDQIYEAYQPESYQHIFEKHFPTSAGGNYGGSSSLPKVAAKYST